MNVYSYLKQLQGDNEVLSNLAASSDIYGVIKATCY